MFRILYRCFENSHHYCTLWERVNCYHFRRELQSSSTLSHAHMIELHVFWTSVEVPWKWVKQGVPSLRDLVHRHGAWPCVRACAGFAALISRAAVAYTNQSINHTPNPHKEGVDHIVCERNSDEPAPTWPAWWWQYHVIVGVSELVGWVRRVTRLICVYWLLLAGQSRSQPLHATCGCVYGVVRWFGVCVGGLKAQNKRAKSSEHMQSLYGGVMAHLQSASRSHAAPGTIVTIVIKCHYYS